MASFIVYGDASGQVTVQAPAVAGSNTITFPAETGTLVTTASTTPLPGQIAWNTTVQTTGFTAVAYGGYFCNTTSAAFTVTLPATPTRGQFVVIVDYAGTSATNNITVSPNGGIINGSSGNAILSTNRQGITFTYIDSTQGWLSTSNVYGGSTPFAQPYAASYLVVAGGGGGGSSLSGGGGAGGLLVGTTNLTPTTVYTAVVGAGGAAVANGSDSSFPGVTTAVGGGRGGGDAAAATSGGSGGGAARGSGPAAYGLGTPGQGNNGGAGDSGECGPGGGGSGSVGSGKQPGNNPGYGGCGTASSITGSAVTYAGGGGGGSFPPYSGPAVGLGGSWPAQVGGSPGGGANGGVSAPGSSSPANTGGGGGGGGYAGGYLSGGSGGSGVVIISVPTAKYTGTVTGSPTVTTSGSNTIITWTSGSGTYTA